MASLFTNVTLMALTFATCLQNGLAAAAVGRSACAQIHVSEPTVLLGSAINASCVLSTDCALIQSPTVEVEWLLNQRIPFKSTGASPNKNHSYSVVIPSFKETRGQLACCICVNMECHIVAGVEIRAGYPPSAPQNLTCVTNLTKPYTLSCTWVPSAETHLPTTYVLHTEIRGSQMEQRNYTLPAGVHTYTIPRREFCLFSEMRIFVKATNGLGQASSKPLVLDPMENALLDPPHLLKVWAGPTKYGCLNIQWRLSEHHDWLALIFTVELRLKAQESQLWISMMKYTDTPVDLEKCGLLHGTEYQVQMRVRYSSGPWSPWSMHQAGTTLEKAPDGHLTTWLRTSDDPPHPPLVLLFWKPSKQFRANGKKVSFRVFLGSHSNNRKMKKVLCNTDRGFCSFHLSSTFRNVFITARNSGGESSPIKVPVRLQTALDPVSDFSVSGSGDSAILTQWAAPGSPGLTGYALEWSKLGEEDPSFISFEVISANESSFVMSENVEPYTPYKVSLYPLYSDGIGILHTMEAYSQQKAPSTTPQLHIREIGRTHAVLTWDKIPVMQRNGVIRNYMVYYWNEVDQTAVVINPEEDHVTLRNLKPFSMYKVMIQASTYGGSRNGTIMTFKTEPTDIWSTFSNVVLPCIVVLFIAFCSLSFFVTKKKWLKMRLWPMVPDPANSSIKYWKDLSILKKDNHHIQELHESMLVNLSWFSILDILEKEDSKTKESDWTAGSNSSTADLVGPLDCLSPPPSPCGSPTASVPYVTVVASSPYRSQAHEPPITYMRSESTQPLLEKEPSSPEPSCSGAEKCGLFPQYPEGVESHTQDCAAWNDFPMLSALMMEDGEVFN